MNKFVILAAYLFITATAETLPQTAVDTQQTGYVPAPTYTSDATGVLENQAYDPNVYQSFVPQDAVQKYVNSYGMGNGYAGLTPTTLEGFLIPAIKQTSIAPLATPTFVTFLKSFLPGPKILFAVLAKCVALVGSAIGVVLFGGAITTFVCSFTPLCSITFLGRPLALLRSQTTELVEKIGEEVTAERVKRAADLFRMAIDKYKNMKN